MPTEAAHPPLAIVGVGCRFPGSHGREGLWETLIEGRDEIVDRPAYRARTRAGAGSAPGNGGARRRGSIGEVESFDWRTFQMSPRESKYVDPQQRLLLETTWEALEDAGLPLDKVAGTRTGVFMGIMWPDYAKLLAENPSQLAGYATSGVGFALAANRISYVFDLRGPSVSLDVQCASSLVAVSLAASSIWSGEAELALAGGVNLILAGDSDLMMSRAGILSPSGSCKTFDTAADGFVRSEGVGVIVMKPLDRALSDGDRVLAVIRGAACNHDGRRAPLTAPSPQSQVELIRRACANAGVAPGELDYVELHGTGTQKGDPIEASALGEAIGERTANDPCLVGSIKTNIGHCESAAGVASVIKVALALHRGLIPPTINHTDLHPAIGNRELGVELVTESRRWPTRGRPWLASVNGLSLGGGNAHVVLEQAPEVEPDAPAGPVGEGPFVLPVSARTDWSLRDLTLAYAEHLDGLGDDRAALRATCAAGALRRTHHERRIAVVATSAAGLAAALRRFSREASASPASLPQRSVAPRVALWIADDFDSASRGAVLRHVADLGVEPACTLVGDLDPTERSQGEWDLLLEVGPQSSAEELVTSLYRAGCEVRWSAIYGSRCSVVTLPTYRWNRERLWIDPLPSEFADSPPEAQNSQPTRSRDAQGARADAKTRAKARESD